MPQARRQESMQHSQDKDRRRQDIERLGRGPGLEHLPQSRGGRIAIAGELARELSGETLWRGAEGWSDEQQQEK